MLNKQEKKFSMFSRSFELELDEIEPHQPPFIWFFSVLLPYAFAHDSRKIKKYENVFSCIRKIWYYFNEIRFSRFFLCHSDILEEEESLSNFDMLALRPQNDSTDDTKTIWYVWKVKNFRIFFSFCTIWSFNFCRFFFA